MKGNVTDKVNCEGDLSYIVKSSENTVAIDVK